jgi:hypothetical protein
LSNGIAEKTERRKNASSFILLLVTKAILFTLSAHVSNQSATFAAYESKDTG